MLALALLIALLPISRNTTCHLSMPLTIMVVIQLLLQLPLVWPRPIPVIIILASGLSLILIARWPCATLAMLIFAMAWLCVGRIRSVPHPNNDVFIFHTDAANALRQGINPYTLTFPNIYYPQSWVYAPEIVSGDRVLFGYPYPPLTLAITSAGHLLLGDARYAMLLCSLIAAFLIYLLKPDATGVLIAALFLTTPKMLFVLEMGWTEPIQALLLAMSVLLVRRAPRFAGLAIGLFIASKQYLPATLLVMPLIDRAPARRRFVFAQIVIAILVATIISLPLVLWDAKAFIHSAITLQFHQPYRHDALSFIAWWGAGKTDWIGPSWVAFVALAAAIAWAWFRRLSFAAAVAVCFFAFFAFNKQAFANYYYFVIAALCCAAAFERCSPPRESADNA